MDRQDSRALVGAILAAGEGRRLRLLSEAMPKPLLPVLDRPLIVWQIEALKEIGVTEVAIVVGRLGHLLVEALGDGARFGVHISYVEQGEPLGTAHAIARLSNAIEHRFVLLLGDIYFDVLALRTLVDRFGEGRTDGVLAVREEPDMALLRRNFSVETDSEGVVHTVIEKPIRPVTNLKGCGLYAFEPTFFDSVRRTPRSALKNEYEITDAIQIYIDRGHRVTTATLTHPDFNLTEPADLLALNLHALRESGLDRYVSESAEVAAEARLAETVVMARASVAAGADLTRCLVMAGAAAPAGRASDTIFHQGGVLRCPPKE
jgi:dTDP-glucose pyrophosphorylase